MKNGRIIHAVACFLLVLPLCNGALAGDELAVLHNFAGGRGDGATTELGALATDGEKLFGMTSQGGAHHKGVVYSMDMDGSGFQTLHEFAGGLNDGGYPYGPLTIHGDTLYGMTSFCGFENNGTVFSINKDGTGYKIIFEFGGQKYLEGAYPYGGLTFVGNRMYGMTSDGGRYDLGTVFALGPGIPHIEILHHFNRGAAQGRGPWGNLVYHEGIFYGITGQGGKSDYGTIFSINIDGSGFTLLHQFAGPPNDGDLPYGSLTLDKEKGLLFGMTFGGGAHQKGVVFRININGSGYKVLHQFSGGAGDGKWPYGNLVLSDGRLYGATGWGGASDMGVLFTMDRYGNNFQVLHEFAWGTGGTRSNATPILHQNTLYGATRTGGDSGLGVVYKLAVPMGAAPPRDDPGRGLDLPTYSKSTSPCFLKAISR